MSLNKEMVWQHLSAIWANQAVPAQAIGGGKYVLISDTHLGDGGEADDFYRNERALLLALDHYRQQGFTLILLGDVEEFWQFDLPRIMERYNQTVYAAIRAFGDGRVRRIFGNHDSEWGGLLDPARNVNQIIPQADEALKLLDAAGQPRILLVHGHQGSLESDRYSWFSRFFVRIFKVVEPLARLTGLYGHGAATKSQIAKDYERTFYAWAKANGVLIICGHSHRAIFASQSYADSLLEKISQLEAANLMRGTHRKTRQSNLREMSRLRLQWEDEREKGRVIESIDPGQEPLPCYFNTGCGLYSDGVTAIEIADDTISLVKWNNDAVNSPAREVYNSDRLSSLLAQIG